VRVAFLGTPEFAVRALEEIAKIHEVVAVYTQPDRPVGRGLEVTACPVKRRALELGLPVSSPEKISHPDEAARFAALNLDAAIVVAYGQILKSAVIDAPRLGCINIHASLLPRWRGAAPIQWSILGGDSETGVTTMRIVPKLDAGDMLLRSVTKIGAEDTATTLHDRLSEMGATLIVETLAGLESGSIPSIPQDESKVTIASKLTKEMERLDCAMTAIQMDRAVRALNPWPGTRVMTVDGKRFKILSGAARGGSSAMMGIYEAMGSLFLGTSEGVFEILRIQEEGKKALSVPDFLNGLRNQGLSFPQKIRPASEWT
jgi:methionyl-tRNA formyltransferase